MIETEDGSREAQDTTTTAKIQKRATVSQPGNWRTVHANIEKMREKRDAPVDVMGCDKLSDVTAEPKVRETIHR